MTENVKDLSYEEISKFPKFKMRGKKLVRNQIWFARSILSIALIASVPFLYQAWKLLTKTDQIDKPMIVLFGMIFLFFLLVLYFMSDLMKTFYNDLLDYSDIEDIADLSSDLGRGKKDFRDELWNQVNRRSEKVKISLLRSIDEKVVKILDIAGRWVPPKSKDPY